jgi:serine/threonine protein kinase
VPPHSAPVAFDDPLIGQVIDGRYRVLEPIGSGGMGSVYLAEHVLVRRKVALKTLHAALSARAEAVTRFHREAVAAAAIGNPHIVDVLDMGRLENKTPYIVMEHLRGPNLARVIGEEGPLRLARSIQIAMQMCEGLEAVHRAGIVHRDLKPENLILLTHGTHDDFVKLLDFGICKVRNAEIGDGEPLTKTGVALGTPLFMAPEQINAESDIDARVDVYATGAILFCMLAGTPPFDARTMPQLFISICNDTPRQLRALRPAVPVELERIVLRALAKSRSARYASAAELRAALASVLPVATKADGRERSSLTRSGIVHAPTAQAAAAYAPTAPTLTVSEELHSAQRPRRARLRPWMLAVLTMSVIVGLISAVIYGVLQATPQLQLRAAQPEPEPPPTLEPGHEAPEEPFEPAPEADQDHRAMPTEPTTPTTPRAATRRKAAPAAITSAPGPAQPAPGSLAPASAAIGNTGSPAPASAAPPPQPPDPLPALNERQLQDVFQDSP